MDNIHHSTQDSQDQEDQDLDPTLFRLKEPDPAPHFLTSRSEPPLLVPVNILLALTHIHLTMARRKPLHPWVPLDRRHK